MFATFFTALIFYLLNMLPNYWVYVSAILLALSVLVIYLKES
jgi:hypothetical protein